MRACIELTFRRKGLLIQLLVFAAILSGCRKEEETNTTLYSPGLIPSNEGMHDFGEIGQMEDMEHAFSLTNVSEQSIRVTGVDASCRCMWNEKNEETLAGTLIAPQEKIGIPIKMNTSTRQDDISGKVLITYRRILENEEEGPPENLVLNIKAYVIPDYRITPAVVDFGTIDGLTHGEVRRVITIAPETVESVAIHNATASREAVSVEILCETSVDRTAPCEIEVVLDVSSYQESVTLQGAIHIDVDSEPMPRALIPFRAEYIAPLEYQPDSIVIGSDIKGDVSKEITIISSCPSQIIAIHGERELGVVAEYSDENREKNHTIQLTIPPCSDEAIDEVLELEIMLFPVVGEEQLRTLSVPVYRFL